jgi:hypothetical protein
MGASAVAERQRRVAQARVAEEVLRCAFPQARYCLLPTRTPRWVIPEMQEFSITDFTADPPSIEITPMPTREVELRWRQADWHEYELSLAYLKHMNEAYGDVASPQTQFLLNRLEHNSHLLVWCGIDVYRGITTMYYWGETATSLFYCRDCGSSDMAEIITDVWGPHKPWETRRFECRICGLHCFINSEIYDGVVKAEAERLRSKE